MKVVKMLRCKLVLLLGLLVLCGIQKAIAQEDDSLWLVSPALLKAGNLEMLWQNKLPIKESESLERLFLPFDCVQGGIDNYVYALSSHNYIVSLNRNTGNMIFSRSVAPVGFPVVGLEFYNDELFSLIGNKLVEIDREFGTERSSMHLAFGETCPVARNSSYFYLGGVDRRVHALRAKDKVQIFEVAADNDSMITSIVADENSVIFATNAGNVISIKADRPGRLWQFDAADGIIGPIVREAGSLFFASKDAHVYKIDAANGKLDWKYSAGAILNKAPCVTASAVYQNIGDKGLIAIDKVSGELLWQLAEGVDLLAESDGKAYVITNLGTLVVMDNLSRAKSKDKKAKRLYSVNFTGVSKYVANVTDSKIYIADETGRIACLKPTE